MKVKEPMSRIPDTNPSTIHYPTNQPTILASDGVISGRRAMRLPLLSSKLYSCCVTSSPALRTYSSCRRS